MEKDRYADMGQETWSPLPVVILAGGTGGRLAPFVDKVPKALVEVNGTPIIDRIVVQFRAHGCNEFWVTTRYLAQTLEEHFKVDGQVRLVGDGGRLGSAAPLRAVRGLVRTPFILSNCDVLVCADYESVARAHADEGNAMTLVCYRHRRVIPAGALLVTAGGNFEGFAPRAQMDELLYSGVSIIGADAMALLGDEGSLNFTELVLRCRKAGLRVGVHKIDEDAWYDMGDFGALARMSRALKKVEGDRSGNRTS